MREDDQDGTATPEAAGGSRPPNAPANGLGDYANGKLRTATRHNWISGVDNQVVETYTYGGTGGAASQRATTAEGQSVSQGFTWTDLGLPASVTYPQIAGIGPARTVSDTYSNGFLTAVPSYATSISYSVNAMPYRSPTPTPSSRPTASTPTTSSASAGSPRPAPPATT